jgi:hypothetical protein
MTPITIISLFTANRFRYWLTAGNVGVRPKQASTARNEPSAACRSRSIRLLSTILRPFGLTPRKACGSNAPAAPSAPTKSP